MKVLHILNELRFSGAEMMLACGSDILAGDEQSVIIATGDVLGAYAPTLVAKGYDIVHLPYSFSPSFFARIVRAISSSGCDVVHLHTERAAMWYSIAARLAGAPNIRTIHNEFQFDGLLRRRRFFTRQVAAALGTLHVACSSRVMRNERKRFGIEAVVVDNWIDPARIRFANAVTRANARQELGIPLDAFVTVSIGNDAPAKNIDTMIEGVGKCRVEIPVRHYHCGSVSEQLVARADAVGNGRVSLLGTVSNVGDYLAASDAFVSASFFEGGQLVLMEAAASGTFCITTEVGVAEEFEGLPNIRFIQPTPDGVAEALEETARLSADEREKGGRQLSDFTLGRFVPKAGANHYRALYKKVIDRKVTS